MGTCNNWDMEVVVVVVVVGAEPFVAAVQSLPAGVWLPVLGA